MATRQVAKPLGLRLLKAFGVGVVIAVLWAFAAPNVGLAPVVDQTLVYGDTRVHTETGQIVDTFSITPRRFVGEVRQRAYTSRVVMTDAERASVATDGVSRALRPDLSPAEVRRVGRLELQERFGFPLGCMQREVWILRPAHNMSKQFKLHHAGFEFLGMDFRFATRILWWRVVLNGVLLGPLPYLAWRIARRLEEALRMLLGGCRWCAYSRAGLHVGDACPECGRGQEAWD